MGTTPGGLGGRAADAGGLANATRALDKGVSLEDMTVQLLAKPEMRARP